MSPPSWSFSYFLAYLIAVVLLCILVLYVILALWPPVLQYQWPSLLSFVLFVMFFLFVVVVSGEQKQKQGRGLVDHKLVQAPPPPPVIFIAGRPKVDLLFWFFSDFRCGALLFMVIHVIYKYKNR